ncbi:MAG: hypothetical protein GX318_05360 [Clostridia bacterium]|nr:hypothetical protein [Clostridia bacterium]
MVTLGGGLVLFVILLLLFKFVKTSYIALRLNTTVVNSGTLEEVYEREALIIKDEEIVRIPYKGEVNHRAAEGERVKQGSVLMEITVEGASGHHMERPVYSYYAPISGVISYEVDGYEATLTPQSIGSLNLQSVYESVGKGGPTKAADHGGINVKIIDNLKPAYLCFSKNDMDLSRLKDIDKPVLRVRHEGDIHDGRVVKESEQMILLRLDHPPSGLIKKRKCVVEIISRREKGVIVPTSSLLKTGEDYGLYRISGSGPRRVQVEVKGIFDELAVVQGIESGTEIISNPRILGKEGEFVE